MLDSGTPDQAIAAFLAESSEEVVRAVCGELEQLMPMIEDMDDPQRFLWQDLFCYYSPESDRLTVANWLEQVRRKLGCK